MSWLRSSVEERNLSIPQMAAGLTQDASTSSSGSEAPTAIELFAERAKRQKLEDEVESMSKQVLHCKAAIESLVKAFKDESRMGVITGGRVSQVSWADKAFATSARSSLSPRGRIRSELTSLGPELGILDIPERTRWADSPLGRSLRITTERRTAVFAGRSGELDAVACTAEPPMRARGYGFDVRIGTVRAGFTDQIAVGFTALPPSDWPEMLPKTADGLSQTWLVGYDRYMWHSHRWITMPRSLPHLQAGDRIGVLATHSGQLEVSLNGEIQWHTSIPLTRGGPPLYGVVDLLGCVEQVTLLD